MKRLLASLLALLVVFSLVPVPAFAVGEPDVPAVINPGVTGGRYSGTEWLQDPLCTTNGSANGNVTVSKTAELGSIPGQFDISLQVDCKTTALVEDMAIVLVLDLSNSMDKILKGASASRLDQLKEVLAEDGGFLDSFGTRGG